MKFANAEFIEAFQASPHGSRIWIPGLGRSMAPLLSSGDALRVERCDESAVRHGDIALLRRGDALVAHIVLGTRPVISANFKGRIDEGELTVIGRAVAIRRSGLVIPMTRISRLLLSGALRVTRSSAVRGLYRSVRDGATGKRTTAIRRRMFGPIRVRSLTVADVEALTRFTADYSDASPQYLLQQLNGRWSNDSHAFAAFTSAGRILGFCFVDDYRQEDVALDGEWLRYLIVEPIARNLGIARHLITGAAQAARARGATTLHADVRSTNDAAMRLFSRLGFSEDDALSRRVNVALRAADGHFTAFVLKL